MEPNVKQIVESTLTRITVLQNHINGVLSALRSLGREHNVNAGNLMECLYAAQIREWKNLFMFGLVVDQKTKDRIKAAAYQQFLSERMHVDDYFRNASDEWFFAGEDEFRRMCRELFAPEKAKNTEKEMLRELSVTPPKKNKKLEEFDEVI